MAEISICEIEKADRLTLDKDSISLECSPVGLSSLIPLPIDILEPHPAILVRPVPTAWVLDVVTDDESVKVDIGEPCRFVSEDLTRDVTLFECAGTYFSAGFSSNE